MLAKNHDTSEKFIRKLQMTRKTIKMIGDPAESIRAMNRRIAETDKQKSLERSWNIPVQAYKSFYHDHWNPASDKNLKETPFIGKFKHCDIEGLEDQIVSTSFKKFKDKVKGGVIRRRSNVGNTVPLRFQAFLKGGPRKS
jgi:hypothetical protein